MRTHVIFWRHMIYIFIKYGGNHEKNMYSFNIALNPVFYRL